MNRDSRSLVLRALLTPLILAALLSAHGQSQLAPTVSIVAKAAPTPPPIETRWGLPGPTPPQPKGSTLYSIGQPTDEEQLYLEYLNRSRANPTLEGQRLATTTDLDVLAAYSYFGVDLTLLQNEFATNPPVPPLAMNPKLMAAARLHSGDMLTNAFQAHNGTDGSTPSSRALAQGYNYNFLGENVYASAYSVFYGHAGFDVDWGPGVGGMQDPAGHRSNIQSPSYREVGVGVVDGSNSNGTTGYVVGPQLVTQDFGSTIGSTPFITGVVYYDLHGKNFYDFGEGLGGVRVDCPGSAYYALTADSGGYALPITSNGNYTVTFTAAGLSNRVTLTITNSRNAKVDYVPTYTPPVISGPNPALLNQSNTYTFTSVGAATSHEWQQAQLQPYTAIEGAENGLVNVTAVTSAGYSILATDLVNSGLYSFHLTHLVGVDQFLTLNPLLRVSATSQLSFAKYLGIATTNEMAHAQITTDDGVTWQDLWTQIGTGGFGDSAFSTVTVPLGAYAGQVIQVRFVFSLPGATTYYPYADSGYGLYLDDIAVSDAEQLVNPIASSLPSATSFSFKPTTTGNFLLRVRAHVNSRSLPWSSGMDVAVATPAPVLQFSNHPVVAAGQVQLDFTVNNYQPGMTFQLYKATTVNGAFGLDASATLQTLIANSKFRFTTSPGSATQTFYRVVATY